MFKTRLISILILLPLFLGGLLYAPANYLIVAVLGLALIAAYEWAKLMTLNSYFTISLAVLIFFVLGYVSFDYLNLLLTFSLGLWLVYLPLLITYPRAQGLWDNWLMRGLTSFITVIIPVVCLIYWLKIDRSWVIYSFVFVWVADTAAYVFGKILGRHKLIPHVSPGKTWIGVIGALFLTQLLAMLGGHYYFSHNAYWLLANAVALVLSIEGDLLLSLFKRARGVKDTGHLIPGHGGLFDRIDSLSATILWFSWYQLVWLGG